MKNYELYFSFSNLFKANEEHGIEFIVRDDNGCKHLINAKTYKGRLDTLATWNKIEEEIGIKISCALLKYPDHHLAVLSTRSPLKNQYIIANNTFI